jgi:hypothetical protein
VYCADKCALATTYHSHAEFVFHIEKNVAAILKKKIHTFAQNIPPPPRPWTIPDSYLLYTTTATAGVSAVLSFNAAQWAWKNLSFGRAIRP